MTVKNYISPTRWFTWDDDVREAWTAWFIEHEMLIDDIASFHVDDTKVHVKILLRNERGNRYSVRDASGDEEAAHTEVSVKHRGSHPLIPDAAGTLV